MIDQKKYLQSELNYQRLLQQYNKRHTLPYRGTPLIFSFLVTNRCNLKCKHCFYHETIDNPAVEKKELTLDEYEKISMSLNWFLTGIFCGGEPFIRDDFNEIIYVFQKNNNMAVADSATNGQLTERTLSQVEKIVSRSRYQKYTLGVSLEGFEELNDHIRGKGTYQRALETWNGLKKIQEKYDNFEPYVCTTINAVNQEHMTDFIKWCMEKMQPTKISLLKIRQDPRNGEYLKDVTPENYKACIDLLDRYLIEGRMGDVNKVQTYILSSCYNCIRETLITKHRQFQCYAGIHGGFIDYDGSVGVCEILKSIGNLRDYNYNFMELWNSPQGEKVFSMVCKNEACQQCTHESEGLLPSISFAPNVISPK